MRRLAIPHALFVGALYLAVEACGLFVIIAAFKRLLGADAATFWVFMIAFLPLGQFLVSGYAPILTREIAKNTALNGMDATNCFGKSNASYLIFSGVVLIIIATAVAFYVSSVFGSAFTHSWIVFSLGIGARAILFWLAAISLGLGMYGVDKLVLLACSIISLISVIIAAIMQMSLPLITFAFVFPHIVAAVVCVRFLLRSDISKNPSNNITIGSGEVWKMFVINLCGIATLNSDLFMARPLVESGLFVEYALLSKGMLGIVAVCGLYITLQVPEYARLAAAEDFAGLAVKVRTVTLRSAAISIIIGLVFILLFDPICIVVLMHPSAVSVVVLLLTIIFPVLVSAVMNNGACIVALGDSRLVYVSVAAATVHVVFGVTGGVLASLEGMLFGMVLALSFSLILHLRMLAAYLELRRSSRPLG
jgi:O-antigen/teichoic acid export membrane protein